MIIIYFSEFVSFDDNISAEMITDEDIINIVEKPDTEEQQDDDNELQPHPQIAHQDAAKALKMLQTYLLQQPDTYGATDDDRKVITKLFKEAEKHHTFSKKQQTLDAFFKRN